MKYNRTDLNVYRKKMQKVKENKFALLSTRINTKNERKYTICI